MNQIHHNLSKPTQILKLGLVCCHLDEWRIICLPFFQRLFHAFHQILFTNFFSFFLELYHKSLFSLNNAWHVVFDMNEVRIFRLLLIKNWSILQQLNYQVIVFFPLMMLWRLVSTSPTTKRFCVLFFVWNFVLIIVMIMKFNWFFLPMENMPIQSTYLPPKLILQPTVFSGNTNTHLVLNASLKFCLNLKFTQPNFFFFQKLIIDSPQLILIWYHDLASPKFW